MIIQQATATKPRDKLVKIMMTHKFASSEVNVLNNMKENKLDTEYWREPKIEETNKKCNRYTL